MRGLADDTSLDLATIMKLNHWPEVTSATVGLRFCSLVAVPVGEGGPIIGKTFDYSLASTWFLTLQRVSNDAGVDYIGGTFLSTLAGIKTAGLTIVGATIAPRTLNRMARR